MIPYFDIFLNNKIYQIMFFEEKFLPQLNHRCSTLLATIWAQFLSWNYLDRDWLALVKQQVPQDSTNLFQWFSVYFQNLIFFEYHRKIVLFERKTIQLFHFLKCSNMPSKSFLHPRVRLSEEFVHGILRLFRLFLRFAHFSWKIKTKKSGF